MLPGDGAVPQYLAQPPRPVILLVLLSLLSQRILRLLLVLVCARLFVYASLLILADREAANDALRLFLCDAVVPRSLWGFRLSDFLAALGPCVDIRSIE